MLVVIKYVVIFMLLLIVGSLFSAMTFLVKDRGHRDSTRVLKALTMRIGLSIVLFLALGAGYYFGLIPATGLRSMP
ncbi:MAG: twin transmembrane helix small protein [Acidiferrobacterales bacterium]